MAARMVTKVRKGRDSETTARQVAERQEGTLSGFHSAITMVTVISNLSEQHRRSCTAW
jgi:hypothetical protein